MVLLLSLALLMRITSVLSYIYNTDYYYAQYNPGSCLPGLSSSDLRQISVDMANQSSTNIFDHLLPSILKVRVPGTQGSLEVRQFIKNEMSQLGWYVEEDSFVSPTPAGEINFSNIIATLNPSVARRIVMACHYDSKLIPGSRPFVAATDSAVPCALLMDAAKQLPTVMAGRSASSQNDFTFQFIFFDGEEAFGQWTSTDSLYGSRHLAGLWQNTPDRNDPRAANKLQNIEFFMLLDLIGSPDTRFVNFYRETSHHFYRLSHLENCLINSNLRARPYGRRMFDVYGRWYAVEDDHVPFMQRGVPILHLISVPFPQVWHTADDNIRNLDRGLVADFAAVLRLFMAALLHGV